MGTLPVKEKLPDFISQALTAVMPYCSKCTTSTIVAADGNYDNASHVTCTHAHAHAIAQFIPLL